MPGELPDDDETVDTGPRPIGVPRDYTTTAPNRVGQTADALSRTTTTPPRYWTGDEWTTPKGLASEDRAALQLLMKQIGLLAPNARIVLGGWDQTSASAFREVLAWANVNGVPWTTALEQLQQSSAQFPQDFSSQAPLVARVSDPNEIAQGLRDAFRERLGVGDIPEEKIAAMVKAFQGEQVAAQRAEYDAGNASGGTVVAAPSFETFADMQAKAADPTAYDSRKVVGAADYLSRKLRGEV